MDEITLNRRNALLGTIALGLTSSACAQSQSAPQARPDLYNGELDYLAEEFPGRADEIPAHITITNAAERGEPLEISGRCLSWQTGEPVPGVIVYAYHTDGIGLYAGGPRRTRHARLRGWMRTGSDGVYGFRSVKPAPYPDGSMPAHVHLIVLEPARPPYWIDDIVFEGEFGVDAAYRARAGLRGGDGVVRLARVNGVWTGVRDIRLERHPA